MFSNLDSFMFCSLSLGFLKLPQPRIYGKPRILLRGKNTIYTQYSTPFQRVSGSPETHLWALVSKLLTLTHYLRQGTKHKMPKCRKIKKTHTFSVFFFTLFKASLILYSINDFALLLLNFLKLAIVLDVFNFPLQIILPHLRCSSNWLCRLHPQAALPPAFRWACSMRITTRDWRGSRKWSLRFSFPAVSSVLPWTGNVL